jgi:hypothetical protein
MQSNPQTNPISPTDVNIEISSSRSGLESLVTQVDRNGIIYLNLNL